MNDQSNEREPLLSEVLATTGYFLPSGALNRRFVARRDIDPLAQWMAEKRLTTTQLRRFFQHCRAIESQLKAGVATWEQLAPKVDRIDSAATRAVSRKDDKGNIPEIFFEFLKNNVAACRTQKDFIEGFLPHFEALVGFAAAHLKK